MTEPTRVESITYRVKGRLDFSSAEPMQGEVRGFRVEATSTEVRLFPIRQFDDYREALEAADNLVRDWEKLSTLEHGEGAFKVQLETYELSGPSGKRIGGPEFSNMLIFSGTTLAEPKPGSLPKLPAGMSFEGTAGLMLERLNRAMAGRELLTGAANNILTHAEAYGGKGKYGKRKRAAAALGMDLGILKRLGDIAANAGGPLEGRKASSQARLTPEDKKWVQDTCRDIILRVARLEAGSDPSGGE